MYIRKNIAETKRGGGMPQPWAYRCCFEQHKKKEKLKKPSIKHICINAEAQGLHTI